MSTTLLDFVRESNRIEGILRDPTENEVIAHAAFLPLRTVAVKDVESFVAEVAARPLRRSPRQNVRVGAHLPPQGGPQIERDLADLLEAANGRHLNPYEVHVRYELLHPFMDGNGRSGRVLWAWQMLREEQDPFALPFLHRFYYQTLDASRRKP